MPPLQFRSIWISDLHLGTRNLQSEQLLDFLQKTESEYLYLVGDILDLLQARRKWYWPRINDRIVQAVLDKAKNGTRVVYIPGNHDHVLRRFYGMVFNNVRISNKVVHETADGRRYLVIHGDKFDPVVQNSPWLATIGSMLYNLALTLNRFCNLGRRRMRAIDAGIELVRDVGRAGSARPHHHSAGKTLLRQAATPTGQPGRDSWQGSKHR